MCRSIACADGLKGFPEAIKVTSASRRKPMICSSEKRFFTSNLLRLRDWTPNRCATQKPGRRRRDDEYQPIGPSWRRNGPRLVSSFGYLPEIRKVIYTSNAIESGELQPTQADQAPRRIPQRRGTDQAALSGPAQHQQAMDAADPRLEGHAQPLYHRVRRAHPSAVNRTPFTQNSAHAQSARSSTFLFYPFQS